MKTKEILAELREMNPEVLLADGFEEALMGTAQVFSKTVALYDREKCIQVLVKRDGMSREDAEEYFDFNVTGAYVGEMTPAFATVLRNPSEEKKFWRRRPAGKKRA